MNRVRNQVLSLAIACAFALNVSACRVGAPKPLETTNGPDFMLATAAGNVDGKSWEFKSGFARKSKNDKGVEELIVRLYPVELAEPCNPMLPGVADDRAVSFVVPAEKTEKTSAAVNFVYMKDGGYQTDATFNGSVAIEEIGEELVTGLVAAQAREHSVNGAFAVTLCTEKKSEPKVEPKEEPKSEPNEEPKSEPKEEPRNEPKEEPKSEPKEEPKSEPKNEPVPPKNEPVPPKTEPVPPKTEPVPPKTEPVPPKSEPSNEPAPLPAQALDARLLKTWVAVQGPAAMTTVFLAPRKLVQVVTMGAAELGRMEADVTTDSTSSPNRMITKVTKVSGFDDIKVGDHQLCIYALEANALKLDCIPFAPGKAFPTEFSEDAIVSSPRN